MADQNTGDLIEAQKRRWDEKQAEVAERQRLVDAGETPYNQYVRPWDGAWNLLEEVIERWPKDPIEKDGEKLAEAFRRISQEAERSGFEKHIRAAADRCRKRASDGPAEEQDKAILFAILQDADDGSALPDLTDLRFSDCHNLVGKCRLELSGKEEPSGKKRDVIQPRAMPPLHEGAPQWSKADSPARWAKRFSVSEKTFKRRCKDGTIQHKKLSDRSYQIDIRDAPVE